MNNDTISRQAAIYAVDEMSYAFNVKTNAHMAFIKALAKLPSAERRGRWERLIENPPVYACTECGRTINTYNLDRYPYCHCGARMVEE